MATAPKGTGRPANATEKVSTAKPRNQSTGSRNDSPRTQRKRPGDLTGLRKQEQDEAREAEAGAKVVAAALEAAEEQARNLDEIVDYTADDGDDEDEAQDLTPVEAVALDNAVYADEEDLWEGTDTPLPEPRQSAVQSAVDVQKRKVVIRVNSKIEDMVFGREVLDEGVTDWDHPENNRQPRLGNLRFYNFEEGRRYKVPVDLALHLEEKKYLYH